MKRSAPTRREIEIQFLKDHADEITELLNHWSSLGNFWERLSLTLPDLPKNERVDILKHLPEWPRIVLAIYEAELATAAKQKERGKPSDIAYEKVAGMIRRLSGVKRFKDDRVKALCNEARRQIKAGASRLNDKEIDSLLNGYSGFR